MQDPAWVDIMGPILEGACRPDVHTHMQQHLGLHAELCIDLNTPIRVWMEAVNQSSMQSQSCKTNYHDNLRSF